ncbi:MAG: hypothetical protein ABI051_15905 [Vicinamibacterales bacterium]
MIQTLLSVLKSIDAPGSPQFLLLGLAVGAVVMWVWPRHRRLGRSIFMGLPLLYLLLALPLTAGAISGALPSIPTVNADSVGPLDELLVFDGDNRRGRVRATARAFVVSRPSLIWVVGGQADWLYDQLPAAGVPPAQLRLDPEPLTTRAQIQWVVDRTAAHPDARMAIVCSRLQIPRIAGLTQAAHLHVPLISAPIDDEPVNGGWRVFVPTYFALRVSRDAIYEHAALAYYRYHGWIHTS